MSTAERLWKEQYNGELSKLQRQLEEAKTSSAPRGGSGEGVGVAVREARETWEREQRGKVEEAVRLAKEVRSLIMKSIKIKRIIVIDTLYIYYSNNIIMGAGLMQDLRLVLHIRLTKCASSAFTSVVE